MSEVKKVNPGIRDVVGEVYNRFTIIENLPSIKYGKSSYKRVKALCECGNTRELCYKDLTRSKIKSCGCINTENKIDIEKNNTYNHWTILKEVPKYIDTKGNKCRKVLAECVCGKQSELILNSLRTGSSKSCGCMIEHKSGYTRVTKESKIPEITLGQMNQKELYNWKVIELISAKRNEKAEIVRTVRVQCKCGYIKETILENAGNSKQCSTCAMNEIKSRISEEDRRLRTRLKGVYTGMRRRCNKVKHKDYVNYGGRGIKIEGSFNTFAKFYEWMISQGYTHDCKLEIDRKDNDGNYSIDNCRLVSKAENSRNMRRNVMTWEIVEDIRYGKYVGMRNKAIAEDIGCSPLTVASVKNFHTWNK